jgi:hypothetical protein
MSSSPWYVTLSQLITHLPLIDAIITSWQLRRKSAYAGLINIMCILIFFCSVFYHVCDDTGWCLLDAPVYAWQQIDNTQAFSGLIIVLFAFITTALIYESITNDSIYWTLFLTFSIYGCIIIVVLTSITGPQQEVGIKGAVLIITFALCIVFIKLLYVDRGRAYSLNRYLNWKFYLAILLIIIAVICFLLNIAGYTWVTHSIWHLCIFIAIELLLLVMKESFPSVSAKPTNHLAPAASAINYFVEKYKWV